MPIHVVFLLRYCCCHCRERHYGAGLAWVQGGNLVGREKRSAFITPILARHEIWDGWYPIKGVTNPPPFARGPGASAPTAGQGPWVLVFAGACQGTAWVGLCAGPSEASSQQRSRAHAHTRPPPFIRTALPCISSKEAEMCHS